MSDPPSRAGGSGRAIRIMLVDDHAAVRSAIRQSIESAGIQVIGEADGGDAAVDLALQLRPDLILIDIDMPGTSGIDVVRMLARRLPEAIIVMLTISDAKQDLVAAVEAGASGYLVKGLAPGALRRAVRDAARGHLAMPREMAGYIVRHFAGARTVRRPTDTRLVLLSPRELEVLRLLAAGLTDREIADVLTVSPRTVETHVGNLLRKLQARNRSAATRMFLER